MQDAFYTIDEVVDRTDEPIDAPSSLKIKRWPDKQIVQDTALVEGKSPLARFWLEEAKFNRDFGLPVYAEVAANNSIKRLSRAQANYVASFDKSQNGDLVVRFQFTQTSKVLPHASAEQIANLERWRDLEKEVLVATAMGGDQILSITEAAPAMPSGPSWGDCRVQCNSDAASPFGFTPVSDAGLQFNSLVSIGCTDAQICTRSQLTCIPFSHIKNGCAARAHEMCRLLCMNGIQANKIFIGEVPKFNWNYHIAPVIQLPGDELRVIDPPIHSDGPVSIEDWMELLEYNGTHAIKNADFFLRGGMKDPSCRFTWRLLESIHAELREQSIASGECVLPT